MLALANIRDYISSFGIAEDSSVYSGKLDNKKEKSIGVYQRKAEGSPGIALGGYGSSSYEVKPIAILVHWNKSQRETEAAAFALFVKLKNETVVDIGGMHIQFIRLMVPEPQDVGTDDNGVYECVIWLDIIYERKGK